MAVARAPGGVVAILTFASVGLLLIFTAAPSPPAPSRVAEIASIPLTDDDGDQALFASTALAPGRPVRRCLEVRYAGPASPGDVQILAEDVSGALSSRLRVTVERGTGGGFASCAGFAGSTVFDGLLADLAATHAGVSTGWVPTGRDSRTYRITVEVLSGTAPGQSSTATFRWLIVPGSSPTPAAPAPEPSTPAGESPAPTPATTGVAPSSRTVVPAPTRKPAKGRWSQLAPLINRTVEITVDIAARTARHSGLPLASILAVALFMLAQNRIDRRDPKLALAPLTGEPYLPFGPGDPGDAGGPT